MIAWPYLIIKGFMPYRDIAIAHTPLLIADLSIFYKIFGVGVIQLKIYTWLLILITDYLVFYVSKKIWNKNVALSALGFFVFWQILFDGNGLWFETLLVPLSIVAYYYLYKKNYFLTGVFWALMFFTKQTAIWFLLPILFTLKIENNEWLESLKKFVFGILSIFLTILLLIAVFGILPDFLNWAVNFGIFILPKSTGQIQLPDLKNLVVALFPFLIIFSLVIFNNKNNPYKMKLNQKINLVLWTFAGAIGSYPRFEYFHFQPAIPYLAFAGGLVLGNLKSINRIVRVFIIAYLVGSIFLFINYFMRNYKEGTRFYERGVQEISTYLRSNTNSGDKVLILNYWDSVYAYSNTIPAATPLVPQLEWYMELPNIQEKMLADLKTSNPKIILVNQYTERGLSSYKPKIIYQYILENYKLKDKINGVEVLIPK